MIYIKDKIKLKKDIEKAINEAKEKKFNIFEVEIENENLSNETLYGIVRTPTSQEFDDLIKQAQTNKIPDNKTFVSNCLIYPSKDKLEEMENKYVGTIASVAKKLTELTNVNANIRVKRL
jgi:hypothetical protein